MSGILVLGIITIVVILLGITELLVHKRNLACIPVRVHVNGTRGKSSVTRLIAGGLRESGIVTCAKTTGTLARMIMPDGKEYPVFRPAKANVIEQMRIVSAAATCHAQALVIECMAVQPHLQSLCEFKFVRATHGVITNARADHLDVMGPGERDVAIALAGMTPVKARLYTCEQKHLDVFKVSAADRKSQLIPITDAHIASITPQDLAGFSYVELPDNVALALQVCSDLGVPRDVAIRGMWKTRPDAGAMVEYKVDFFGRRLLFINGFAANDPQSTGQIWRMAIERWPEAKRKIAIFNCRADRPDRSMQLGQACVEWPLADKYLLIGSGTYFFAKAAASAGLDSSRIIFAEDNSINDIVETIVGLSGRMALIMGMGNIGGPGLELVHYFSNRCTLEDQPPETADEMSATAPATAPATAAVVTPPPLAVVAANTQEAAGRMADNLQTITINKNEASVD